ncbi:MAG: protoporphyrinogen oxidase [Planctomycetota bacterium]|nr:protoporphyrinogen oxidase [Planctomycetota bacterium]
MKTDVAILGAGLSGLGCASFLRQAGIKVAVLEKDCVPGGKVQTVQEDGYVVELGPLGWLDKEPAVAAFVNQLGLEALPAEEAQGQRWLLKDGSLHLLPSGPLSFLRTPLLSGAAKLRLMREPFISARRDGEESIHDFATRRFGKGVADTFFGAMVSGIFGGDARALSVQAAFPLMAGWESESGSCLRGAMRHMRKKKAQLKAGESPTTSGKLHSLPQGMGQLLQVAAQSLGSAYHGSTEIDRVVWRHGAWVLFRGGQEVGQADHVVFTTPACVTAQLLEEGDGSLRRAAAGIQGASLQVVTAAYAREQVAHPLSGFGFLALRGQGFRPLGVQYPSTIFPSQTPSGKVQLRVLLGGSFDPEAANLSDQALQQAALHPLRDLLGVQGDPERVWMRRIAGGIPQYALGHLERLAVFQQWERQLPGLYFAGDSLFGVGVNAVLKQALAVSERIQAKHFA